MCRRAPRRSRPTARWRRPPQAPLLSGSHPFEPSRPARVAGLDLVVARLAWHEHARHAAGVEDDAGLDGLDAALARGLERIVDRLDHRQLLQMADRREDQLQLLPLEGVEGVLRPQPGHVDTLLAVA